MSTASPDGKASAGEPGTVPRDESPTAVPAGGTPPAASAAAPPGGTAPSAPTASDPAGPDGVATTSAEPPPKRRNLWVWICALLAVAVAGLLIWALTLRSDLDSTNQDVQDLQSQVDQNSETGSAVVTAAKGLFDDLSKQLGATKDDLASTQEDLDQAEKAASDAEQKAADAKQTADQADDATAKAKAETDQAKAETEAAQSKAAVASDCAKAYVSAFGALLEGNDVSEQAPAVRQQLQAITAECKAALSG